MSLGNRRWWAAGGAGLLAAAALATAGALLAGNGSPAQATAGRQYTTEQACLLTDSHGIAAPPASTVWAGMEAASQETGAKVTYLMVQGRGTAGNVVPYANSLIVQHCNVVLAVGAPQVGAVSQIASRSPATTFIIVSSETNFATGNLKTIGISADTESQVKQALAPLLAS